MDITKVLAQLREELENIDAAIASLERLQFGGKRRGRPPAHLAPTPKTARSVEGRTKRAAARSGKQPS